MTKNFIRKSIYIIKDVKGFKDVLKCGKNNSFILVILDKILLVNDKFRIN